MSAGIILLYRNFHNGVELIRATDTTHKIKLRWLHIGFWYMIAYSVFMPFISCMPPMVHNVSTVLMVMAYVWFAARFNAYVDRVYHERYPILTEAGLTDNAPETVDDYSEREASCREKVERWVAEKNYTKGDQSREDMAQEMGLKEEELKWYFAVCLKEDLRSWRVNLRIELAKEILKSNPDAPINELAKAVGFTSRNNLYTHFRKFYDMTPREYGLKMQQESLQ